MASPSDMAPPVERLSAFVLGDVAVPEPALERAATLLLDTVGVAAGAVPLDAGRIARETALDLFGARADGRYGAPMMFDGRRVSLAGAAFAGATQIDNLDAHDGYNPTKGHIGCAVVPALLAFSAERPELSGRDALTALCIAYEVSACAGIALHATVTDYHTSGAWNALGVAALGCRLLGAEPRQLREALGIAEYHGPRSQMMREIANPTMLHDGSGIGAHAGVMATLMAMRGFVGAPALTVEAPEVAAHWSGLETDWTIERNYIKPYPVCRWAHAAIDAVRELRLAHGIASEDIARVAISTFNEAACLFPGMPSTTSQAQYSLAFAVATMLVHGRIGVEHVVEAGLHDAEVATLVERIEVHESRRHSDRFPAARYSDVTVTLNDGQALSSGDVHARGGLEAPLGVGELRAKFDGLAGAVLSPARRSQVWESGLNLLRPGSKFAEFASLVTAPPDARLS